MTLEMDVVTAIDQYFARYGRRRHRLARLYRSTVEFMVDEYGTEALDRLEMDIQCPCCDQEQDRVERLSWMKSKYRRRNNARQRT
ncbi:hypothetical protein ACFFV7_12245 [Nonomuraea spiralis]|uniref:Uncharacterized protein n=1 Tax=Nonomuraea spiralis TaxID=46182 RepID=A0ABV5ICZ9_9ACTN|nr:hypothetical protein [Nonomuraea spiralis]GGS79905.1 hypothetical protein GCM10010176_024120 [Nonomuraea spiralis]